MFGCSGTKGLFGDNDLILWIVIIFILWMIWDGGLLDGFGKPC